MSTAQGGTNLPAIRAAVERAFLTKFKFSEFGSKPCDPPFSIPRQAWGRDVIEMAAHLSQAGFPVTNVAEAVRCTFDVSINDGIEALAKLIDRDVNQSKSKSRPKTRGLWNWIWRRDTPA